jgi:MGT family glycosyltransferase
VPGSDGFAVLVGQTLAAAGLPDSLESIMASPYLDICPPSLQPSDTTAPWTQPFALAPSAGEVDKADQLPAGFADLPHPETVYLTLGTIMNQQPEVFRAVLAGCTRLGVNVLTTVGPGVDPADLGPQPDGVLITDYVSQALVFPHCAAVASHVGAGTMLGALCFGLPQLALPQGTDQPQNSAALVATGAAVALQPDEITADAVAASLDRVLRDPAVRAAAEDLRTEIEAMPTPDAVLDRVLSTIAG